MLYPAYSLVEDQLKRVAFQPEEESFALLCFLLRAWGGKGDLKSWHIILSQIPPRPPFTKWGMSATPSHSA